ncbi:MAG: hypothetical protein KDN05_18600 [Verrucomicrobiae bacterium]|nr:hypothetical protein [Verrucomicrobiae bacterium]
MPIRDEQGLRQIDNLVAEGIVRFPENGKKEFGFPSTFPDAAAHVVSGFYRPDHRRHGIKYVVAWKHEEREPWNVTSAVATFDHEVFEMCESVQDDRWIREHIIEFPSEGSKTWLRLQECKNR